jgi:hypothetical protein
MKLTLRKKLGAGFGCILALMVLSVLFLHLKTKAIEASQDYTFTVRVPGMNACKELQRDLNQGASKTREAILAGSDRVRWDRAKKAFDDAWNTIE